MGQIIDWIAHGFNLLNFVPTLGSCIMAVVSTLSMVAVLKAIPDYMAPVRTLPLFCLIFAHSYAPTLASNHEFTKPNHLYSTFSFCAGRAESSVLDRLFQSLIGRHITISDESLTIFQKLRQRSRSHYCKGEKSDQFKQDFQAWKTCLPHFQRVFFRRRMLCLAAFVLESGVILLSFAALKLIFVREGGASWVELSSLEVLWCVWLSLLSDYLRAAVMVEFTFSTMAEHCAMMLRKMQSKCFDWCGFGAHQACFLTNGRAVSLCVWPSEQRYLPFGDAATIGLVLDTRESFRAGAPVLLSVETGRKLRVYRRRGLLLGTQVDRNIGLGLWAQEFSDMEEWLLS